MQDIQKKQFIFPLADVRGLMSVGRGGCEDSTREDVE